MEPFFSEKIFAIGAFPVTNTILDTLFVDALIIIGIIFINRNLSFIPSFFQNAVEIILEAFYNITASIATTRIYEIFTYFFSFFIFIVISNWSGLLPGISTIGFYHGKVLTPLLRAATTDLNTVVALTTISIIATHSMALKSVGIKDYLSRYFSLNPLNLFVGILEIISEFTKVVSLSFRLYGNIFAGEVLIGVISGIFALLLPLPFFLLEVIIGLVQALIFSMLTMAFMAILTTPHHSNEEVNTQ